MNHDTWLENEAVSEPSREQIEEQVADLNALGGHHGLDVLLSTYNGGWTITVTRDSGANIAYVHLVDIHHDTLIEAETWFSWLGSVAPDEAEESIQQHIDDTAADTARLAALGVFR